MSKFCGKCDFYDSFIAIECDGDEAIINEKLKTLKLYVIGIDGRNHLVKSDTIKDIAKYYPYLTAIRVHNSESDLVLLSSDSFIDREEETMRNFMIDDVLKYWRKCKRNKQPFVKEECIEKTCWHKPTDEFIEIVNRVDKNGDKASFDDIHLPIYEKHYRKEWFDELVRVGYTEYEAYKWVYKELLPSDEMIEKRLGRKIER